MAILLDAVDCRVTTPSHGARLDASSGGDGRPELVIEADGGEMVWRFEGLALSRAEAGSGAGPLDFVVAKGALLEQRGQLPEPQAARSVDVALADPLRGRERWGGRSRPVEEEIGRFSMSRAFAACPLRDGFVADTAEPPVLSLGWAPAGGEDGVELRFHADLSWDAAPDRRWERPLLELRMPHAAYADIVAVLRAVA